MVDEREESFLKELVELGNHALNDKDYQFPFTALVVGADCSVVNLEFVDEGSVPNFLYEKIKEECPPAFMFPLTVFFYCKGREPFFRKNKRARR